MLTSINTFATNYDYQLINGIYYHVKNFGSHGTTYLEAYVANIDNPSSTTEITIPQTIKAKWYEIINNRTREYETEIKVVGIKRYGPYTDLLGGCKMLKTIKLPSSITEIEIGAFDECSSLTDIFVDEDNSTFCSIDGILYSKDKTRLIKVPSAKQEIEINSTTKTIVNKAFYNTQLKEIFIPKEVEWIGDYTFSSAPNLTNIQVDSENTCFCSDGNALLTKGEDKLIFLFNGIEFYSIPNTVTECQNGALNDNKSIRIIVLPNSLEKIPDFKGCQNLGWIFSFKKIDYYKLPIKPTLYMPSIYINPSDFSNEKIISLANTNATQSKINISTKDVVWFTLEDAYTSNAKGIIENENVTFSHLAPDKTYMINIKGCYESFIGAERKKFEIKGSFPVSTLEPILNIELSKATNTTMTVKGTYEGDMTVTKKGFVGYNDGDILKLESLFPGQEVYCNFTITTDDGSTFETWKYFKTKNLNLNIAATLSGTSCILKGSFENIDATIIKSGFKESNSDELKITGLDPNTSYTRTYYISTKEGGIDSKTITFTTEALQLETLQPKGVTNTCSIVSANSNIDDDETTAGFQWIKYDAPSSLKPNEGYATVYNGTLEGYIKNLQTTSYYKVRAFYKSQSDKYYYGDWVTFDPSDFSYFEPTVHTYNNVEVKNNSAILRGVVLQGSDDITEQGFEYWSEKPSAHLAKTEAQDRHIVYATGQRMEAEIKDLVSNAAYYYRAFARTSKNTTYGETLQFEVPDVSSIQQIENTNGNDIKVCVKTDQGLQLSVVGTAKCKCSYKVFSMTGSTIASGSITADGEWHRVSDTNLQTGIYIIQMYDGYKLTSKKVAIR